MLGKGGESPSVSGQQNADTGTSSQCPWSGRDPHQSNCPQQFNGIFFFLPVRFLAVTKLYYLHLTV